MIAPRYRAAIAISCLAIAIGMLCAAPAIAADTPGTGWQIVSHAEPTLVPGQSATIKLDPLNVGAHSSQGPVEVTDTLPTGVTATDAGEQRTHTQIGHELWDCAIAPGSQENSVVTCVNDEENMPSLTGGAGHWTSGILTPGPQAGLGIQPSIAILVQVAENAPEGIQPNSLTVSGGGGTAIAAVDPLQVTSATPDFGFARWGGWFSNADGSLDNQAGSVPYSASFSFDLARISSKGEVVAAPSLGGGEPRNISVNLPPGFIGNASALPQCTRRQLAAATFPSQCPPGSLVGLVQAETGTAGPTLTVFNMVPPKGQPAQFGFPFENINTFIDPVIRTGGDYGITTHIKNVPQKVIIGATLTLWGVPTDPSHNAWRRGGISGCTQVDVEPDGGCNLGAHPELKPFLRLPTACAGPLPFSTTASNWTDISGTLIDPVTFLTDDAAGEPASLTGCNQLPFDPTISSKPTTNVTDAPTGLDFTLHIPQPEGVNSREEEVEGEMRTVGAEPERHEADLKNAVVTLPKGIAVNPASANGLAACSSAQIGMTSAIGASPITTTPDPATCPDAAKIGSVSVETPLLDHPLEGAVYVAAPQDNPFGSLLAIYIAVNDTQTGTVLKLAGKVEADPATGQLKATFANNPQLPFEDFHLNFFGGANAALRTPSTCGTYETTSQMTPWSSPEGADGTPSDSFETTTAPGGGPCPTSPALLPNKPTFSAGTITPRAGAYSPFVLHLARQDGSQEIKGIDTTLPEGLTGKLAGISECSEAQLAQAASRTGLGQGREEIANPSCPLNSEVGKVTVGAGAGPDPYYVQGHAYLAGPYKGAPLSLEIVTPAVAGPYDLGAVAVRTALYLNPETAQIHAVSDPIPTILQGIPLDVRSINLEMNRNQFTLNPTSCAKKTILASSISVLNQPAALSSPFQVGECSKLGFAPKLKLSLKGATKRNRFPSLKAVLTYPKGSYANIARASVALPHSEFLEQAHIGTICTRVQFAEGAIPGEKCPAASVYGFARAITPLLDKPVEGPVYLRSSSHNLPDLVAALNGQIHVDLVGRIDTDKQAGIRNTFDLVPDAPVSKFVLEMKGGKKGLLVNSENICRKAQRATAKFTAQNGKVENFKPLIGNSCRGKGRKVSHKHNG